MQLTNPVFAFLADCGFGAANQIFNQGWYDNQIAVDPKNQNIVWTAGIDAMRSDDGGRTGGSPATGGSTPATPTTRTPTDHAITFHPKYNGDSNRELFVASDGGVHRTQDARAAVGTTLDSVCGEPAPNQIAVELAQQRLRGDAVLPRHRLPRRQTLHGRHAGQRHAARHLPVGSTGTR